MVEDYSDREQEELVRNWLRDNWRWMVGGVALGVVMLVGWDYWGKYKVERAGQAAVLIEDVRKAIAANETDKASKLVADLNDRYGSTPYTQEARLQLAKLQAVAGKYDEALVLLKAVAADSKDEQLRQVALLRQARILIQQGKHDQALQLLEPKEGDKFAPSVQEVRGDALFAKGDKEGARAAYAAALKGEIETVNRSIVELKLQQAGGTVPEPEPPTTTTAKVQP